MVDDPMRTQVVVLGEVNGARTFPIFIGHYEAVQLDMALRKFQSPRPLTHDLVLNTIEAMGGQIDRIIVDALRNETFFGKLAVTLGNGEEALIDSRPSDAIVIAMKTGVPIFADDSVLAQVCREEGDAPDEKEDA